MRHRPADRLRAYWFPALALVAALAMLAMSGCGKSPTKPSTGQSDWTGTVTGKTISGKLTILLGTSSPVAPVQDPGFGAQLEYTAMGTFTPTAGVALTPVTLTGTYDDTFKAYTMYGSGPGGAVWLFTGTRTTFGFRGNASDTTITGEVVNTTLLKGKSSDVTVILGNFTSTSGGPNGLFNFTINGTDLRGDAVDTNDVPVLLDGTYTAGAVPPIAIPAASPTAGPTPATGTLGTTTASGTYADGAGATGTWTGTKQP